jgi:Big-like domain-containing protein
MNQSLLRRAAVLTLAVLVGCGSANTGTNQPAVELGLTASATTVFADGTNTVVLHVAAGKAPVTLITSRGAFDGGARSIQLDAIPADVTLHTCNALNDTTCAGTASINATDAALNAGRLSVAFAGADACLTNCGAATACANVACRTAGGVSGFCSGGALSVCTPPVCTPTQSPKETSCSDGIDNDCNGTIDCKDSGCDGQPCKAGAPTWTCKAGACTEQATGFAIDVSPARARIPADGAATTVVTAKLRTGADAAVGVPLTFSTTSGTLSAATGITGADGTAQVTFTGTATPGVATITAKVTAQPAIALSTTVTMPALGSIALGQGLKYNVMGVKGSGFQESNQIVLSVLDDHDLAYPEGLAVQFVHQPLGGSSLVSSILDTTTCQLPRCATGITDANGAVAVNLASGTIAGTLSVVATAAAGGQTRSFNVPGVSAIGAKANAENFSVDCSPRNVPALAETTCSTSLVDAPFTCVALLKDRYGNLLGTATQVTFKSEAGAVGQVPVTKAYDPTKDATSQADLGTALQIVNTLGAGLPIDVAPVTGEPKTAAFDDGCGSRVHNPRDGVVTVIAIADGEEAFTDVNGNGAYDGPGAASLVGTPYATSGEPFIDLGEPFVDANDNGQWDVGEWFMDVNGNGTYDGPNGKWDATAKIWTETVVVYTGKPATVRDGAGKLLGTRWVASGDVGTFASACTATPIPPDPAFTVKAANTTVTPNLQPTRDALVVVASDENLNMLASPASYAVTVQKPGTVDAAYRGLPKYADEHGLFFRFWPCDKNGANCETTCNAAPANLPCKMTPSIPTYSCGVAEDVIVTGAAKADGSNFLDWNVDLPFTTFNGTAKVEHDIVTAVGSHVAQP